MVLDTSLLNTQYYKVRIKGKVEQSRRRSCALPLHLSVVVIEKGAYGSPSTKGRQLYLLLTTWEPKESTINAEEPLILELFFIVKDGFNER